MRSCVGSCGRWSTSTLWAFSRSLESKTFPAPGRCSSAPTIRGRWIHRWCLPFTRAGTRGAWPSRSIFAVGSIASSSPPITHCRSCGTQPTARRGGCGEGLTTPGVGREGRAGRAIVRQVGRQRGGLADGRSRPVVFGQAAQRWVEAGVERLLQGLRRQPRRFLPVVREVHEARDEGARVRSPERFLSVQVVEQVADRLLVERHSLAVALVAQDAAERLGRRVAYADLVGHAAQESFVDELGG